MTGKEKIGDVFLAISNVNLFVKPQMSSEVIYEWAEYICRKIDNIDADKVSDIVDMYSYGIIEWNSFTGIQNIIRPLLTFKKLPCLDSFYEELPNGSVKYKGYEYSKSEWSSFIYMQWHYYQNSDGFSKDSIWEEFNSLAKKYVFRIEHSVSDKEFVNSERFNKLKEILS